jgi:hypothetical protein
MLNYIRILKEHLLDYHPASNTYVDKLRLIVEKQAELIDFMLQENENRE